MTDYSHWGGFIASASDCEDFKSIQYTDPYIERVCSHLNKFDDAKNIHQMRAEGKLSEEDINKLNSKLYDQLIESLDQEYHRSTMMLHVPLIYAASKGYTEAVQYLKEKFPETLDQEFRGDSFLNHTHRPNKIKTIGGLTFLVACLSGKTEVIPILKRPSEEELEAIFLICLKCQGYYDFFTEMLEPDSWDETKLNEFYRDCNDCLFIAQVQTHIDVHPKILFIASLRKDHPFRLARRREIGFSRQFQSELLLLWPEEKLPLTESEIVSMTNSRFITNDLVNFVRERSDVVLRQGWQGLVGPTGPTGAVPPGYLNVRRQPRPELES